jgi:DNA repair protein RadA/Sms
LAKATTRFVCQQCAHVEPKWAGRCPSCGEWNSLVEEAIRETKTLTAQIRAGGSNFSHMGAANSRPRPITEIEISDRERQSTYIPEFDRVLGGGIVPGSLTLIGGEPGIGKCVVGETRILDPATGALRLITDWAESCYPVVALEESGNTLSGAAVSAFLPQGIQPTVLVTTRLGRTLRCTETHPVLTIDGWRPVGALCPRTQIATPRRLPFFGSESQPDALVRLIAYILSDGSAGKQITVTSLLPEVAEDLKGLAQALGVTLRVYDKAKTQAKHFRFVVPYADRLQARRTVQEALCQIREQHALSWAEWARRSGFSYRQMMTWRHGRGIPTPQQAGILMEAIGGTQDQLAPEALSLGARKSPVMHTLDALGMRFQTAATKSVPGLVFRLPKEQLRLFLKVLFSCDGSVYAGKVVGVSYSTISRQLAEDIQHLLLRFGLVAKLRTKPSTVNGSAYTAYELQLLGVPTVRTFLSEIGIWGRHAAIATIAALPEPELGSTHYDTIPLPSDFWLQLRALTGRALRRTVLERTGLTLYPRRAGRPISRRVMEALAEAFPTPYFQRLASGDVFWDEIVSVTPAEDAHVYDLSVPGKANFVAADLIVHNSTLMSMLCGNLAAQYGTTLYISGEESVEQIKLRAVRLDALHKDLLLASETDIGVIAGFVEQLRPKYLVIDSIQTMISPDVDSAPGTVSQVRAATSALAALAKGKRIPIFLVGHVTKEGAIAGPRVLEHMVDTVLYFEGDAHLTYRILRAVKNRFGSTDELGIFEMRSEGLVGVDNPSAAFLAERPVGSPGSTVTATMEGSRALLVEVQALVAQSYLTSPRRVTNGVHRDRVSLVLAVLEKRLGLSLANMDVFVSVAGGVRVEEPSADLAIALAVAGSFLDRPVSGNQVFLGEIGLAGEVRSCTQIEKRLREAAGLGFGGAILPQKNIGRETQGTVLELQGIETVRQAVEKALLAPQQPAKPPL